MGVGPGPGGAPGSWVLRALPMASGWPVALNFGGQDLMGRATGAFKMWGSG